LHELMIVGGGPAGSAAAIALARAGHRPVLIERNAGARNKVCGDFLSGEAVGMLERFGVDLSAASTIRALRLVHRDDAVCIRLPFTARGLSREVLDEALLRQADASGAVVLRGHRVASVQRDGERFVLSGGALGNFVCRSVFLATGKHELRGAERLDRGTGWIGLKMYYQLDGPQRAALRDHIELILLSGGYAGLQLIEAEKAVLCVLLRAAHVRAVGGQWDPLLDGLTAESSHLRRRLTGAAALLDRPLSIAGLPFGYLHAASEQGPPRLFRLGDQAAVIASLAGDGVALALASGMLGARSWMQGRSATEYHRNLAGGVSWQLRRASLIHRLCLAPVLQPWVVALGRLWPQIVQFSATSTRAACLTHTSRAP
jgi:flavin-dependent dehydrogenase